jgi:hypothetical protein
MQYAIHDSVMPQALRSRGAKVWVGDSILHAEVLRQQGLRAVSILMWRDVFGEVSIIFAMPEDVTATREEISQCRQCALEWISEWEAESHKFIPRSSDGERQKSRARCSAS